VTPEEFVAQHTAISRAPLVPEVALHLASEITPIWQATEAWLAEQNIEPPFWAFAWPGGQALARAVLDQPSLVAGKRVLYFAAGCGIAAPSAAGGGALPVGSPSALDGPGSDASAAAAHSSMRVSCGTQAGGSCERYSAARARVVCVCGSL
jgi:predicted nicotinamide N-methyase